jgi:hypothetical protein
MEKDLHNDNFKGALFQNFDEEVVKAPETVWENVEKELFPKKKKIGIISFSSFLIFCFLSIGSYLVFFQNPTQKSLTEKQKSKFSSNAKNQSTAKNTLTEKNTIETSLQENKIKLQNRNNTQIETNDIQLDRSNYTIIKSKNTASANSNILTINQKPNSEFQSNEISEVKIDSNRQQFQIARISYLQPILTGSILALKTIIEKSKSENCNQNLSFQVSINRGINVRKIEGEFNTQSMKSKTIGERRIPTKLTQFQFGINYHLNNKFAINSGIFFGKSTFQSRWFYRQLYVNNGENAVELRTMNGEASLNDQQIVSELASGDTILYKIRANYSASFYSIPIGFTFRFNNHKFSPFFRYGISLDFHSKANISLDIQKNGTYKSIDLNLKNNSIQFALQQIASFGFEFKLNNNLSTFLESKLAIPTSKINVASDYKLKSSYFTLGVGVIYKLPCKNKR